MKIISVEQMQLLDKKTIEDYGIPGRTLMERAGKGIADHIEQNLKHLNEKTTICFIAGRGNNGGDAFVAARILATKGISSKVLVIGDPEKMSQDAAYNYKLLENHSITPQIVFSEKEVSSISLDSSTLLIDGLLGTGLTGPVRGLPAAVITCIQSQKKQRTIAIDIPSGLNGDTGIAQGPCIQADETLTMALPKKGLLAGEGLNYCGKIVVIKIGIAPELIKKTQTSDFLLTSETILHLPKRKAVSHKGTYGHVLIIGGSTGMTGAPTLAALAAESALRSGAGLVTVGVPASLNPVMEVKLIEAMSVPLPDKHGKLKAQAAETILQLSENKSSLVFGPGLSREDSIKEVLKKVLSQIQIPVVIDADGLWVLAEEKELLKKLKVPIILTPHPGEMARLTGKTVQEIQKNRWESARAFAQTYNVIVVLKGAGTVIADGSGDLFVNITGNPGMASGGMGDVLAGLIGSLIAQGMSPQDAAKRGVFDHGRAADMAIQKTGERGLLASDLVPYLGMDYQ